MSTCAGSWYNPAMQKAKMAIFDLDHTLFDTTAFKKDIFSALKKSGVSGTAIQGSFDSFMAAHGGNYDMLGHCEELREKRQLDSLDAIHAFLASPWEQHLIAGAKEVLKELRERGYRLVLLTKGSERFQKTKIAQTGLAPFFDEIRIVPELKEEELAKMNLPERSYFINDSVPETDRVRRAHPNLRYILFKSCSINETPSNIPVIRKLRTLLDMLH